MADPEKTLPSLEDFQRAFVQLAQSPDEIVLELSHLQAWVLLSQLQLALRHPANNGSTSKIAREIALRLQEAVAPSGTLRQVADCGWDPRYDLPI